ncbi:hypothetical protein DID77_00670 [Candidatus Marinamargulisbacteria bacterium SCGC AG-439-L15]|nr:hypothetical protein DID77_00670 [Candidatus Marinamargulisbacteria bacterium SCGC AG-439-L15]
MTVGFILIMITGSGVAKSASLSWELMSRLNYKTGKMPDPLKTILEGPVEVTGFIVPLEMDSYIDKVKEFLLVPDPMSCIHVPPPPPNQMVYVKMNKEIPLNMDFRGVVITGRIAVAKSKDGVYSFTQEGVSAKEGTLDYEDPVMEFLDYEDL